MQEANEYMGGVQGALNLYLPFERVVN